MIKVLIVASYNNGSFAPFIVDQVNALVKFDCEIEYFGIVGKGLLGYLSSLSKLKIKIDNFNPDIIHAHYGLSGLLANLQRNIPVVTTYHGSDINKPNILLFSKVAMRLSAYNIFVSQKNVDISGIRSNFKLLPCGVDLDVFYPINRREARLQMGLNLSKKYVLFSSHFNNTVKNPQLAIDAIKNCGSEYELLELKGYLRDEVNTLMNAVDCVLMTSNTEGSPQFIKEAMAVNCPIISVNVGDVEQNIFDLKHCSIVNRDSVYISNSITDICGNNNKSDGREKIIKLFDNNKIAKELSSLYTKIYENLH